MEPLQIVLTLVSAFIGPTSLLVAPVALGARWEGRSESDRKLAEAERYESPISQHPSVLEATALRTSLDAFRAAEARGRRFAWSFDAAQDRYRELLLRLDGAGLPLCSETVPPFDAIRLRCDGSESAVSVGRHLWEPEW